MSKVIEKPHFYILQCCDFVKIGVSKKPNLRIKELQTGNPFKITLLLYLKTDNAYESEKYFHRKFDNQRGIGEWFKINEDIKEWVINMKNYEYMQNGGR